MSRVLLAAMAAMAFFQMTLAVHADDDLPKPDAKNSWHIITQDDATTTSHCIGKRDTPLCALDTRMAAEVRGDSSLWYFANGDAKPEVKDPDIEGMLARREGLQHQYQVLSVGHFKQGDPVKDLRGRPLGWVPGDVWITIYDDECYSRCGKASPATKERMAERYIFHKSEGGWSVVHVVSVFDGF